MRTVVSDVISQNNLTLPIAHCRKLRLIPRLIFCVGHLEVEPSSLQNRQLWLESMLANSYVFKEWRSGFERVKDAESATGRAIGQFIRT